MEYLLFIWEYIINISEVSLFAYICFSQLEIKCSLKKYSYSALVILSIILTLLNHISINLYVSLFIMLMLEELFCYLFFINSLSEKIFWGAVYELITIISEKITFSIFSLLQIHDINSLMEIGINRFHATILYICICAIIAFLVVHICKNKIELPFFYQLLFVVLAVITIIGSSSLLGIVLHLELLPGEHFHALILNCINYAFLFSFFAFIFLIRKIGILNHENNSIHEQQLLAQKENEQVKIYLESAKSLRTWKHDYQNHIDTIWNLYQNQNYDELGKYISETHSSLPDTSLFVSTGNITLDAVISMKFMYAKQNGIQIDYQIIIPDCYLVDSFRIANIINTLLDNAIEACSYCSKPYISLIMKPQNEMLFIKLINSSDGHYSFNTDGTLMSRKADTFNHGIGLIRVKQIIAELSGFLEITPNNVCFEIKILLPSKNEGAKKIDY